MRQISRTALCLQDSDQQRQQRAEGAAHGHSIASLAEQQAAHFVWLGFFWEQLQACPAEELQLAACWEWLRAKDALWAGNRAQLPS